MRIIGGSAGGAIIKVPKGLDVRPTPDRVREALFNSLGPGVDGVEVLEVFAGTGALSLEALSRGARRAVVVELSRKHAEFIKGNLRACRLPGGCMEVRVQDTFAALRQLYESDARFDWVLADPPYGPKNVNKRSESFAQKMLDDPHLPGLLKPDGLLVLGHTKRDTLDLTPAWTERKMLKHGDTIMRILLPTGEPHAAPQS